MFTRFVERGGRGDGEGGGEGEREGGEERWVSNPIEL